MQYSEFLKRKEKVDMPTGLKDIPELNQSLIRFQRDIVKWALKRGRAAIFADCGLGKTLMQLEWADKVCKYTGGDCLILAPLAVSQQTKREGDKFGINVNIANSTKELQGGINVTNYQKLGRFDASKFAAVILDESSILKNYEGATRNEIMDSFGNCAFKLACTATPAPNDFMELGNHAEFLGAMNRTEMLSMFFVHDGGETQKWRLKGHAEGDFWKWVCSWAVMIKKPSNLGYSDDGFALPELRYHEITVSVDQTESAGDFLFRMPASTLQERRQERRLTTEIRCAAAAQLVNASKEPWLIWCNLNDESARLAKLIDGAVEVNGSQKDEFKESMMMDFSAGRIRALVTKPSIAGFGMNWQHCRNVAFVGLSDSYEQFYQAIRRCWRFGQKKPVECYIITAETEGAVVANIKRKEDDAQKMADGMVKHMQIYNREAIKGMTKDTGEYKEIECKGDLFEAHLGDCVDGVSKLAENSIHYSIFSPPFASLYTYSNSERDMGNCADEDAFMAHFGYLVKELHRVLMPGRLVSFHCMNLPTSKCRNGYIGIHDFRGELIRLFESHGFVFHSEVCIWKDPVTAMQRTKAIGLLHKQLCKDSALSRQGIPDYLVTMRKLGENPEPVAGELDHFAGDKATFQSNGRLSIDIWQRYASPVWMDINPSNTLQHMSARDEKDERHICPLQLDVIERGIQLWSNPGDLVLSPFMGIGSEGHVSIKTGRRFIGFELKESYWKQSCKNLKAAESSRLQTSLIA